MSQTMELKRRFTAALGSFDDAPEFVTVGWVARTFGITTPTVHHAIKVGNLRAEAIKDADGKTVAYNIRSSDALALWSHRLLKTKEA